MFPFSSYKEDCSYQTLTLENKVKELQEKIKTLTMQLKETENVKGDETIDLIIFIIIFALTLFNLYRIRNIPQKAILYQCIASFDLILSTVTPETLLSHQFCCSLILGLSPICVHLYLMFYQNNNNFWRNLLAGTTIFHNDCIFFWVFLNLRNDFNVAVNPAPNEDWVNRHEEEQNSEEK